MPYGVLWFPATAMLSGRSCHCTILPPPCLDAVAAVALGVDAKSIPRHALVQTPMVVQLTAVIRVPFRILWQRAMM